VRTRLALPRRGDPSPQRGGVRLSGIAIPQQQVQLVRVQAQRGASTGGGPAGETTLGEALVADPEPLTVVGQAFDGVPAARAEHEQRARKRVVGQRLPAQGRQAVDAFAEVYGLDRHQNRVTSASVRERSAGSA